MPVAGLEWHLQPASDVDPGDAEHAKRCREAIEETPNLQQLTMTLQECVWYGRYASQLIYDWDWRAGYRRAIVRVDIPVNGDKLIFRYTGEAGILVSGLWQGDWIATDRGRCHIFSPEERQCIIIHRFEREDADFFEPELGGRIEGVGVRDRLYWFLYMKNRVLAWLMEFLERVGAGGLTIYYYESGNQESLAEVRDAAEKQKTNNAILFPRYIDGKGGPAVERIEPSEAGASMLLQLVTEYFDSVVRRVILGQNLSSSSASTGLGSGVADFQAETLNDIIKYDARNLEETLTRDFVATISRTSTRGGAAPSGSTRLTSPTPRSTSRRAGPLRDGRRPGRGLHPRRAGPAQAQAGRPDPVALWTPGPAGRHDGDGAGHGRRRQPAGRHRPGQPDGAAGQPDPRRPGGPAAPGRGAPLIRS